MHGNNVTHEGVEVPDTSLNERDLENCKETNDRSMQSKKSLLKNWSLISTIIVYCVFSLHDTAYSEVLFFITIVIITDPVANLIICLLHLEIFLI